VLSGRLKRGFQRTQADYLTFVGAQARINSSVFVATLLNQKETVMTDSLKKFAILGLLAFPLAVAVGCENEGPFERAGENVDDAADDVGDDLEDAGEEVDDAVDDIND
jgi:hypothetical protein